MKSICNFCSHKIADKDGSTQCGKAIYSIGYYGNTKQGSVCVHDNDLQDLFLTISGEEIAGLVNKLRI